MLDWIITIIKWLGVDWTALITTVSGAIVALATAGGVVAAWVGLDTWKKQLRGTTEYELAKRVLMSVYGVRDSMRAVRDPFISPGEADDAAEGDWELSAYQNRWGKFVEVARELDVGLLEAEVVWENNPLRGYRAELNKPIAGLVIAIRHLTQDKRTLRSTLFSEKDEKVLYAEGDDDFDKELTRIVGKFEDFIRPHLKK